MGPMIKLYSCHLLVSVVKDEIGFYKVKEIFLVTISTVT
jgi:hypothetical protein